MSSTATLTWSNQVPSNTQELYYGKDLLATGLPGSGTGWTASDQNPLPGAAGSITISNLDDNVKYKFLLKSDCTNSQNIFSSSTGIKWVCSTIQTAGPVSGILAYTLPIDPSVSNPGSPITQIVVSLSGIDRINNGELFQSKSYGAPFSANYTDQFNNVNGDVDWTLRVSYHFGTFPALEVYTCSSQTYSTTSAPLTSYLHIRNALVQGTLSQLTLGTTPQLTSNLQAGYAAKSDITTLISSDPLQVACTFPDVLAGTLLTARQIRGGLQIAGGTFPYGGTNSNISSTAWNLQNGDVVEIADASALATVFKQVLVNKNSSPNNGYDISVSISVPQGALTSYTVTFTAYDYSTGVSETFSPVISLPQGQTVSTVTHVASTFPLVTQYSNATITHVCVTPPTGITVPYYYNC